MYDKWNSTLVWLESSSNGNQTTTDDDVVHKNRPIQITCILHSLPIHPLSFCNVCNTYFIYILSLYFPVSRHFDNIFSRCCSRRCPLSTWVCSNSLSVEWKQGSVCRPAERRKRNEMKSNPHNMLRSLRWQSTLIPPRETIQLFRYLFYQSFDTFAIISSPSHHERERENLGDWICRQRRRRRSIIGARTLGLRHE